MLKMLDVLKFSGENAPHNISEPELTSTKLPVLSDQQPKTLRPVLSNTWQIAYNKM